MKNLYHICTGFLAKTVVMIVLLITSGVNVVWGEDFNYTSNVDVKSGSNLTSVGVLISSTKYAGYKLGTSNNSGSISFTIPKGTCKISFFVAGWKGDGEHNLKIESTSGILSINSIALINDPNISGSASNFEISKDYLSSYFHEILLSDVLPETTVTLRTNSKRAVVWGINYFTDVDDDALCVKFNAGENGTYNGGDVAETVAGDGIVLPDVAAKDGWVFIGWATSENSTVADAGKAGVVYHPSSDGQVLYAVYEMASVTHTVKFFVNGEQVGDTQELHAGDDVVFPDVKPADINGKKFVGWLNGEISKSQDDVPLLLENAKMENSDIVLNAVFAKKSDDGSHTLLSDHFDDSSRDDSHKFESDNFTGHNYNATTSKFGGVKLGTAQYNGYITTKPLNLSQSFTVSVKVKGYGNSGGTLQVSVDNNKQSKTYNFSATSEQDYETAVFTFEAATTTSTIKIGTTSSSKRAYIDDVVVTTTGSMYSGYCTSLLTVKKAVSVVTSENRQIDLTEEEVTKDFVEAVSNDETVKGKNVIVFAGKGIEIGDNVENVAVRQEDDSYLCRKLVLTDDGAFSTPEAFMATEATYSRAVAAGASDYGTICLPYDAVSDANMQYYRLVSCSSDALSFVKVDNVKAYTPALYRRLTEDNVTVSASNVQIAATGEMVQQGETGKMVGVMKPTSVVDGTNCKDAKEGYAKVVDPNCYYIKGGQFWELNERVNLKAFRAYISCDQVSGMSKAAVLSLCFEEDMPTDVRIIERKDGLVDMVYDLGGRRGGQNARGVRIVNGRKIVQR